MAVTINNDLKLSGLSSGLDTENIVKGMLSAYQTKLDRQQQTTTKLEWTEDAYREINTLVKNFREKYLSVLSDTNMMSASAYSDYQVTLLSGTNVVSVSASSGATPCTMTIDSIEQLAMAATMSSTEAFEGETYSSATTLDDLELANPFIFDGDGKLSFSINGQTFTFNRDTTIGALMKEVNASDAGVKMSYSTLTQGFTIRSSAMGSASTVAITNIAGNAFSAADSAFGIAEGTVFGQNAECTIEGIEVSQPTNTFSYDGITYTLAGTTDEPVTFTVAQSAQSTVERIKTFINAYNDLIDDLQGRLDEKIYRDYTPLTDAQRDEMSDEEVKLWEEKAKSGLLHSNSYVSTLLTTLRSAFYTVVDGTGMTPSDIGLSTGLYSDGAKITIDEDKLRSAIERDPDSVKDLFVQSSVTDQFDENGLVVRISEALLSYTKQTTNIALDSLDENIRDSEDRVSTIKSNMADKEEALWKKFSVMETAMSKLNGMSSWLSSLFASTASS